MSGRNRQNRRKPPKQSKSAVESAETALVEEPKSAKGPGTISLGLDHLSGFGNIRALPGQLVFHTRRMPLHLDPAALSRRFLRVHGMVSTGRPRQPALSCQVHSGPTLRVFVQSFLPGMWMDQLVARLQRRSGSLGGQIPRRGLLLSGFFQIHRLPRAESISVHPRHHPGGSIGRVRRSFGLCGFRQADAKNPPGAGRCLGRRREYLLVAFVEPAVSVLPHLDAVVHLLAGSRNTQRTHVRSVA